MIGDNLPNWKWLAFFTVMVGAAAAVLFVGGCSAARQTQFTNDMARAVVRDVVPAIVDEVVNRLPVVPTNPDTLTFPQGLWLMFGGALAYQGRKWWKKGQRWYKDEGEFKP